MTGLKKLFLSSLLFITQLSYGGGWTSGGGELIRDAHNPWFLANTKEVKYCIQINEKEFGQSKEFVRERIAKAFDFWKMQLAELTYVPFANLNFQFNLGTQVFHEVSCTQSPDIAFQFADLKQEQKERLGDLSKTIAVSVRTDYDLQNLKGKGFIYFNRNEQFPERPWTRTDGSRVLLVLIHELGHVFGVQHTEDVWMMGESFPEQLLNPRFFDWTDQMSQNMNQDNNFLQTHLFTFSPYLVLIGLCSSVGGGNSPILPPKMNSRQLTVFQEFFGRKPEDNCYSSGIDGKKFSFRSGKDGTAVIGEAQLVQENLNGVAGLIKSVSIVHLWVPPEQILFPADDNLKSGLIGIASFQPKQFYKGTYKTLDGKVSRPMALEVLNNGVISKISGSMNGEIYLNVELGF